MESKDEFYYEDLTYFVRKRCGIDYINCSDSVKENRVKKRITPILSEMGELINTKFYCEANEIIKSVLFSFAYDDYNFLEFVRRINEKLTELVEKEEKVLKKSK